MDRSEPESPPGVLTARQRARLRSLGNRLKVSLWIGKEGLTEPVVDKLSAQLDRYELIKVKLLKTAGVDRRWLAGEISGKAGCRVVQVIGNSMLLYRKHPSSPRVDPDGPGGEDGAEGGPGPAA
ncbi:MAG: YhbY family RNA-binding protein [Candidatus Riflebacteria bacterium]|nr:YhbY family RNA-binding protein [Candidatus Riflebacteria bacterium]